MTYAPPMTDAPPSPPWPATAGILLAFAALMVTVNGEALVKTTDASALISIPAVAPIVLAAVAILASLLFNYRLEQRTAAIWIVRGGVCAAAVLYTVATTEHIEAFFYMNFVARIFSLGFVAEAAIQHWQRPPKGQQRNAILVFLAAILFVLASRTSAHGHIKYFTPPFIMLLVLSMRASRPRFEPESGTVRPWILALAMAILMGCAGSLIVSNHSAELMRMLLSIIRPTPFSDYSDANARPVIRNSFNLPLSQKRVFRVEGTLAERHFRGMTFESYATNGSWVPSTDLSHSDVADAVLKTHPGGQRLTITPLIENVPVLFVPLHMDGVDAKSYRLAWSREWGGAIYATSILAGNEPYQIAIVNETHKGPLTQPMNERLRKRCLELPPDMDPRVAAIAAQLPNKGDAPRDKLETVRKYLYRNHSYSLVVEPGPGDPVANFIIQKRDGHCQFFAAAAVLLLRSINVPARYVTGYYAHESPEGDVTIVRQRDAHAWAEAWIDGEGWVTFDATPSGGMPGQSGGVSFWSHAIEKLGDVAESIGAWLRESPLSKLALIACGVAALGFALKWIRSRHGISQSRSSIKYASPGREFDALAAFFDAWLRRQGVPCPPQRPWQDHIEELKKVSTPADPKRPTPIRNIGLAEAFVRNYSSARFGGVSDPETVRRLNDQLRALG